MNEYSMIEVHVISKHRTSVLDIDCKVGSDTTILDLIEIIFINYHLELEGISTIYAFVPFREEPVELHKDDCQKTLRELDFFNGITFRVIYVGDQT